MVLKFYSHLSNRNFVGNFGQRVFIRFVRLRNRRFFGRSKSIVGC